MSPLGAALLHYPIALPADYPMAVIRERVRTRGHLLDDRAGLILKAYCVTEIGVDGAVANSYAPFYHWDSTAAAGEFLWGGGGFGGIVTDFGRPAVLSWLPVAACAGGAGPGQVTHAHLTTRRLTQHDDLTATAGGLTEWAERTAAVAGVHRVTAGIDPTTWEEVRVITTAGRMPLGGRRLTVLHVSEPGR